MEDNSRCICGHDESDHHISWFPSGYKLIEECEFYGWNEQGGGMFDESTGNWITHCLKFILDKEANHGQ